MSYKPRTLFGLIEEMNFSLFLPHIQRPFVWDEDQMRRLFDSLMRNYPIQTFLFWRTKDYIKARKFMSCVDWDADLHNLYDSQKSAQGVDKVFVLDGQQRLQTLYALFNGAIQSPDGQKELEAYVDVTSGLTQDDAGLLHQLQFSASPLSPQFYRLRRLLGEDQQKNAFEVATALNKKLDEQLKGKEKDADRGPRQERVLQNIFQVVSLLREEKFFWVQQLDGVANEFPYKRVLDIFIRVNSGGTKLEAADLMFAAMKEGWSEIEEKIEVVVALLNGTKLEFDKDLVLKCLVVAHGKGSELSPEKFGSADGEALLKEIEANWPRAESAFQELRDFIEHYLQIYSGKVVRTFSSFIPLFDYLYHNPKPTERGRVMMRAYYYKSQLFNWYRAQTDSIVNVLHGIVGKSVGDFPLKDVCNYFKDQRGADVKLAADHLKDNRLRFIFLNLLYVERFGKSPFNVLFKGNEPHVDHIYPQSTLRSRLSISGSEVNHLGNYRFVGATDNIRKRAELPDSFFSRLKAASINIENHLLLPDFSKDPMLLKFDATKYRDFRDRRFAAIAEVAKNVVNPES